MTEEYVDREDCARLCDIPLAEREVPSMEGLADCDSTGTGVGIPRSDSRRLLELLGGKGLAPVGLATLLFLRSARYEATRVLECTFYGQD